MDLVSSLMCNLVQGNLISHPLNWDTFMKFVADKELGELHDNKDAAA